MAASSPNRPPPRSLEPWAPASCPPTRKALLELCSDRHPVPAPRATVRKPCPTPASPTPPHACLQNWGPYSASSLSHASVFPELGCASYSPPRHPELCSRETPFTQHEPLSSRQAGLLTSGPGNPRVSRAEAGRGLGPSSPARMARPLPHWHAGGTHRWNQSSLLRAELLSRELGAFISSVLGSKELGAERAHLGTQSLLLTAISRHSCR